MIETIFKKRISEQAKESIYELYVSLKKDEEGYFLHFVRESEKLNLKTRRFQTLKTTEEHTNITNEIIENVHDTDVLDNLLRIFRDVSLEIEKREPKTEEVNAKELNKELKKSFDKVTKKHSSNNYVRIIQTLPKTTIVNTLTTEQQKELYPRMGDVWAIKALKRLGYETDIIKQQVQMTDVDLLAPDIIKKTDAEIRIALKLCLQPEIKESKNVIKMPTGILRINNFIENVETFHKKQPFYYDKSKIYWFWDPEENKWTMVDETDVMNAIEKQLGMRGETITSSIKNNYLEAFKRIGRELKPEDPPKTWIQFKNVIYDYETKKEIELTAKYFMCNPIPWNLGTSDETPTIDKLFTDWVGLEFKPTLYEIIAYCCITDYPIHTLFCFIGSGRNGKSKFQELLGKFIGSDNICSTELDLLLENRFESAKLFKKLVCSLGETNFGVINKTSLLKKLVGQDLIGYEFKNKMPFDDKNYAKIIISSNSLPISEDTSEGFYRRWITIDFPNEFPEGKNIIDTIPEVEFENLARKVVDIIPELLGNGKFTNQGTIADRKSRYIMASNPLPYFLEKCCKREFAVFIRHSELYTAYCQFLQANKRRRVSRKEFNDALLMEGFECRRTNKKIGDVFENTSWIEGLCLVTNWANFVQIVQIVQQSSTSFPIWEKSGENSDNLHKINNDSTEAQSQEFAIWVDFETMLQPCSRCGTLKKEVKLVDYSPICFDCFLTKSNEKNGVTEEKVE